MLRFQISRDLLSKVLKGHRGLGIKGPKDRGPERNYKKKIRKAARKEAARGKAPGSVEISSSLLDKLQSTEKQKTKSESLPPVDLSDVLSDIKIYIRSDDEVRRNLGMPRKEIPMTETEFVRPVSKTPMSFKEGKRLGVFTKHAPGTSVMPEFEWDFHKEDEAKQVALLNSLRPYSNVFERMIKEDSSFTWKYPIDNEAYRSEEEEVGFEEHVFLDKQLDKGFPKKGPVRHFMELVVTGLSKNPYYSPQEKRAHIDWYREYFSQFPEEELQVSVPSELENAQPPDKSQNA